MSTPGDPADPITQLGQVLADAERHVRRITAAAEQRTRGRRGKSRAANARPIEPGAIDALLSASAAVHRQLEQLRALVPSDATPGEPADAVAADPTADAATTAAAAATSPPPSPAAVPVATNDAAHDHDLPIIDSSDTHDPAIDRLDSARLIALSMAAAGRSRAEVEAHLRDDLGLTDFGALIDYVFGISTPESVVPSWPPRRRRRNA